MAITNEKLELEVRNLLYDVLKIFERQLCCMDENAVDFFSYFILMTQTRPFAACVSSVAQFPAIFSSECVFCEFSYSLKWNHVL
jgi:hypothetical protein